jgi:hypothetical protein
MFRTYWRDPAYNVTRIQFQIFVGFLFGLMYFKLGYNQTDLNFRIAAVFFTSLLAILASLSVMQPIFQERALFYREHDS